MDHILPRWLQRIARTTTIGLVAMSAWGLWAEAPRETMAQTKFVEVGPQVRLEVIDWGGTGRPVVFLHGLGCDAHVYDTFAPKFTPRHRVLAVSRRGCGASSAPKTGYGDERFGRDLLAVIDALKLERPVLVGHSIAGAEMSWLNTHAAEKFGGWVYLDAGYPYAFYSEFSNDRGNIAVRVLQTREGLTRLVPGGGELHPKEVARQLLADLPRLQEDLRAWLEVMKDVPEPTAAEVRSSPAYLHELFLNGQKYTALKGPILAIFAVPHGSSSARVQAAQPAAGSISQADAFEYGVPSAKVVRLQGADHFVFRSNEAEVIREMMGFMVRVSKADAAAGFGSGDLECPSG